jgi:hypothetical protein
MDPTIVVSAAIFAGRVLLLMMMDHTTVDSAVIFAVSVLLLTMMDPTTVGIKILFLINHSAVVSWVIGQYNYLRS